MCWFKKGSPTSLNIKWSLLLTSNISITNVKKQVTEKCTFACTSFLGETFLKGSMRFAWQSNNSCFPSDKRIEYLYAAFRWRESHTASFKKLYPYVMSCCCFFPPMYPCWWHTYPKVMNNIHSLIWIEINMLVNKEAQEGIDHPPESQYAKWFRRDVENCKSEWPLIKDKLWPWPLALSFHVHPWSTVCTNFQFKENNKVSTHK